MAAINLKRVFMILNCGLDIIVLYQIYAFFGLIASKSMIPVSAHDPCSQILAQNLILYSFIRRKDKEMHHGKLR